MRSVHCCDEDAALQALSQCGPAELGRTERETGYTALHHACEHGMERLASALLARGAALGARTRDLILQKTVVQPGGQTPLHLAARSGEAAVVDLLLDARADVAAADVDGVTPAVAAALHRRLAVAGRLADVAGRALPTAQELEVLAASAKAAARERVAKQLEVPDHLRHAYTLEKIWTDEECAWVLAAVNAAARGHAAGDAAPSASAPSGDARAADGWTTERHAAYATTDLPCGSVPEVDRWVRESLRRRALPLIARRHGWLPGGAVGPEEEGSRLVFRDLFFVRYSAAGQSGLALHRDGSILSFNILLNDASDFDGGGTYIEADDRAYHIGRGDCFVHSGKLRHGGHPITRGERYVLVAFVDVLEDGEVLNEEDL